MKKAISVLLITLVAAGVFAGCQKRIYFDEEEYMSAQEESVSAQNEAVSKQEAEIMSVREEFEQGEGKTKQNERLSLKFEYGNHMEYRIVYFKKNGKADYMMRYLYFYEEGYYERVKGYGDDGDDKLIKADDETRCLVYKSKDTSEMTYDEYYEYYKDWPGCTIY